jgi:hypothetical protein
MVKVFVECLNFVIPRRWNREGDIVFALSVRPNFVYGLVLYNYWMEFNETLWESSISRADAHTVSLYQPDPFTQSSALDYLCSMHIE